MFYALAKNEEELKHKINLFVACSPVMRLGTEDNDSGFADDVRYGIEDWLKSEYMYELGGKNDDEEMKNEYPELYKLMAGAAAELGSSEYNDPEREIISFSHPQPLSWKQLAHYSQIGQHQEFEEFDY